MLGSDFICITNCEYNISLNLTILGNMMVDGGPEVLFATAPRGYLELMEAIQDAVHDFIEPFEAIQLLERIQLMVGPNTSLSDGQCTREKQIEVDLSRLIESGDYGCVCRWHVFRPL